MLDEKELERLCHGRIIYADLMNSANSAPAGPHYAVILDSDENIKKSRTYNVVAISHNSAIDSTFIMPVPPRTGLDGFIVGSWLAKVHELGIKEAHRWKLLPPEMIKVIELVRAADAARKAT